MVDATLLERPPTPFIAMHAAVALLRRDDAAGLDPLARACDRARPRPREVVAPLARALGAWCSATRPARPTTSAPWPSRWRVGGTDAQREIVEETRIAALVARRPATTRRARCSTAAWTGGTRRATQWRDDARLGSGQR